MKQLSNWRVYYPPAGVCCSKDTYSFVGLENEDVYYIPYAEPFSSAFHCFEDNHGKLNKSYSEEV